MYCVYVCFHVLGASGATVDVPQADFLPTNFLVAAIPSTNQENSDIGEVILEDGDIGER